jgi:hypothetical protein
LLANSDLGPTCSSVVTADGRAVVAVGCTEGVWIGFRHDYRCEVCAPVVPYCRSPSFGSHAPGAASEDGHAMCDARGLWNLPRSCQQGKSAFLLSEPPIISLVCYKSLFAYDMEALLPSSLQSPLAHTSQTPQKLNDSKDVQFFSFGSLGGRTFVIYMKKKGVGPCSALGSISRRARSGV